MAKITIPAVSGGFNLKTDVNTRLQQVEDELNNKVLYRANPIGEANSMSSDIDMGGNSLLNYGGTVTTLSSEGLFVGTYQALRDYVGEGNTIYVKGQVTAADGGEAFFQKKTGAAIGTYVDDGGVSVLVPTGGDGSVGWIRTTNKVAVFTTMVLATEATNLLAGDVLNIEDRLGTVWDVVLVSTVTPNALNIVQSVGAPLLALVLREEKGYVTPEMFGAVDNTDITSVLAAMALQYTDITVDFDDAIISSTVVFGLAASTIDLKTTSFTYPALTDATVFDLAGANSLVIGGNFIGTAVFDDTNTQPAYEVIKVSAADVTILRMKCEYTKKVFIRAKDVTGTRILDGEFQGNYPTVTGSTLPGSTGHFCILLDPGADFANANYLVRGCRIGGYVQGIQPANYGAGGVVAGCVITGNTFYDIQDHGVYTANTNGATITGNSFLNCHIGVVITGDHNNVSSNVFYSSDADGTLRRAQSGISIRSGSFNTVTGNSVKMHNVGKQCIGIDLQYLGGSITEMRGNVISSNSVEILSGTGAGIRAINNSAFGNVNLIGNTIADNTVIGKQDSANGLISMYGVSGTNNYGNKITGNTVVNLLPLINLASIQISRLQGSVVNDNNVTLLATDNVGEIAHLGISVTSSENCVIRGLDITIPVGYGADCRVYIFREYGTCVKNTVENVSFGSNGSNVNLTPIPVTTLAGSDCTVDVVWDSSSTAAPTIAAATGSRIVKRVAATASMYFRSAGAETNWTAII